MWEIVLTARRQGSDPDETASYLNVPVSDVRLAPATQTVFAGVAISTRRVAMASGASLRRLLRAARRQRRLGPVLRETLTHLSREGRRSRPKRDRETGRLQTGLEPCSGEGLWFWSPA